MFEHGELKIGDFGSAKMLNSKDTTKLRSDNIKFTT
jgi:hypothetical protein